ncbi:hypothetical protein D9758_008376 [Tetrapyrgos nigripes]|uniref:ribonuclease H n=1 Tax=Tetrapyrgos nigripes TaxID=182062 RepID=A0A8H5GE09_9AGAR|nr:hypothetical protein D9758_008376 [Tetrapyrgos nigripes]
MDLQIVTLIAMSTSYLTSKVLRLGHTCSLSKNFSVLSPRQASEGGLFSPNHNSLLKEDFLPFDFHHTFYNRFSIQIAPPKIETELSDKERRTKLGREHDLKFRSFLSSPEHLVVYADGSVRGIGRAGVGLVGYYAGSHAFQRSIPLNFNEHATSHDAEIAALNQASIHAAVLTVSRRSQIKHWQFFSDCEQAVKSLSKPQSAASGVFHEHVHEFLKSNPEATVEISWVPGHSGVLGNTIADKLAKAATRKFSCACLATLMPHDAHKMVKRVI